MLFVFAGEPPAPPPAESASVHILAPGVYHQSLNPQSGDTYYLSPGSYVYGSLNLRPGGGGRNVLEGGAFRYDEQESPSVDVNRRHAKARCYIEDTLMMKKHRRQLTDPKG